MLLFIFIIILYTYIAYFSFFVIIFANLATSEIRINKDLVLKKKYFII